MTPLSYTQLEYGAQFTSELCPEGIVAIAGNTLRIITLDKLGETFNQIETPLRYTPRRFVIHPLTNLLVIIETDHNAYPLLQSLEGEGEGMNRVEERWGWVNESRHVLDIRRYPEVERETHKYEVQKTEDTAMGGDESTAVIDPSVIGAPPAGDGRWASCVRLYDVYKNQVGIPSYLTSPSFFFSSVCLPISLLLPIRHSSLSSWRTTRPR